jgi:hypothetical protein
MVGEFPADAFLLFRGNHCGLLSNLLCCSLVHSFGQLLLELYVFLGLLGCVLTHVGLSYI